VEAFLIDGFRPKPIANATLEGLMAFETVVFVPASISSFSFLLSSPELSDTKVYWP
jgi:hypothetical protein